MVACRLTRKVLVGRGHSIAPMPWFKVTLMDNDPRYLGIGSLLFPGFSCPSPPA
jgi:hypothetical protein